MDYPNSHGLSKQPQIHLLTEHTVRIVMCMIATVCTPWDSCSRELHAAKSNTSAHRRWDSSSRRWELKRGRGKHSPCVILWGYLVLRSTETLSSESAGCPLLCCFLVEWVVCFHHLGMQAWKGEQRDSRKAADIGQNSPSSSRETRKTMLSNGCNSELASSYSWSRSSNKRPWGRDHSKDEIWEH